MNTLFVEDVKVGVTEGGIACGPVPGNVVAEVCVRDQENGTVKYYSLAEVEGITNFSKTDISTFDAQMRNDSEEDAEIWDMLYGSCDAEYDSYESLFENMEELEQRDPDYLKILKYLVYMVRAEWKDVEKLKKASVGKCFGDFEIPMSDAEKEYMEEIDAEEEGDD